MDGPRWYHVKWDKSKKDKIPYDFTYIWNLKYILKDAYNKQVVAGGAGVGRLVKWVRKIQRHKLPVMK